MDDECCKSATGVRGAFLRRKRRSGRGSAAETSYTIGAFMVRFLTAGESHGRALVVILEGIPAGLPSTSTPSPRICGGGRAGTGAAAAWRSNRIAPTFCPGCAPAKRSAVRSPCRSTTATGSTGSTRCGPRVRAGGRRWRTSSAGHAAAARPRRSGGRRQIRPRRRPRHPGTGERARDRCAGGGRCGGASAARCAPASGSRATCSAVGHGASAGRRRVVTFEQAAALRAGRAAALRGPGGRAPHDRRRSIAPARRATPRGARSK